MIKLQLRSEDSVVWHVLFSQYVHAHRYVPTRSLKDLYDLKDIFSIEPFRKIVQKRTFP